MENWREHVEATARTWLGTPYMHKGRIKGVGVDCGGLVYEVFNTFLPLPAFPTDYAPDWAVHRENEIYLDFIMPFVEEVQKPVFGGIIMVKYGRNYSHAAICVSKDKFIHAWGRNQVGHVIESKLNTFVYGHSEDGKPRPFKAFDLKAKWQ